MTTYKREMVAVYATAYPKERGKSAFKVSVEAYRITNTKTHGKGQDRLRELCDDKFTEIFDDRDDISVYDVHSGYELDDTDLHGTLNTKIYWIAEEIHELDSQTVDSGVERW